MSKSALHSEGHLVYGRMSWWNLV